MPQGPENHIHKYLEFAENQVTSNFSLNFHKFRLIFCLWIDNTGQAAFFHLKRRLGKLRNLRLIINICILIPAISKLASMLLLDQSYCSQYCHYHTTHKVLFNDFILTNRLLVSWQEVMGCNSAGKNMVPASRKAEYFCSTKSSGSRDMLINTFLSWCKQNNAPRYIYFLVHTHIPTLCSTTVAATIL